MLAIFLKDLRLLLGDRAALILTIIAPLIVITVITQARYQSAHPPLPLVPIVDLDGGPAAGTFIEILGKHANVSRWTRRKLSTWSAICTARRHSRLSGRIE
jgi:hypothetical protein